jgi:hypothetical protein
MTDDNKDSVTFLEITAHTEKNANEPHFLQSIPGKITRICEHPIRIIGTNHPAALVDDIVRRTRVSGPDHANENKSLKDVLF